jgi:hypothetical protein
LIMYGHRPRMMIFGGKANSSTAITSTMNASVAGHRHSGLLTFSYSR